MNWYEKESAVYVQDEDEPYMRFYDVPDNAVLNDPFTWWPTQEEDESIAMIERFGNPGEVKDDLEQEKQSHSQRGTDMNVYKLTERLDKIANQIEKYPRLYGMSDKQAHQTCLNIDKTADALEEMAPIAEDPDEDDEEMEEEKSEAVTIQTDDDEPYMDHYDIGGVMDGQQDGDEPYMDQYDRADAEDQFDYPLEGETGQQLQGGPLKDSSRDGNWYEGGSSQKTSSDSDNWYDGEDNSTRQANQSSNWYDRDQNRQSRSSQGQSSNWYERS